MCTVRADFGSEFSMSQKGSAWLCLRSHVLFSCSNAILGIWNKYRRQHVSCYSKNLLFASQNFCNRSNKKCYKRGFKNRHNHFYLLYGSSNPLYKNRRQQKVHYEWVMEMKSWFLFFALSTLIQDCTLASLHCLGGVIGLESRGSSSLGISTM